MLKSTTIKHLVTCYVKAIILPPDSLGQDNIYKAISDAEKTVFTTTTYNRGGGVIGKSAGFFIGSSGLAIVRASTFVGADRLKSSTLETFSSKLNEWLQFISQVT